ncbi:MAG: DUF1295 domain-containing protein [Nannocystaceae bacterium]
MTQVYLSGLGIVLAATTLLWMWSVRLKNAGIVDVFWGSSFILLACHYFAQTPAGNPVRKWLVLMCVFLWGARLTLHIGWRNHGPGRSGEDFRYQAFRQHYGPERYWWFSLFQVFWLQGALAWLISAPLLGAQSAAAPISLLDGVALLVWVVGFVFEAGADLQLARFRARRRPGQLLTTGFWRYTRHPNYFGDAACWWGFGLFAVAAGAPLGILGSALMTFLLVRVSGVAMLERTLKKRPGYAAYARRTSAFLPWFPRRD